MSFPTVECVHNGLQMTFFTRLKIVMTHLGLPLLALCLFLCLGCSWSEAAILR